MSYLKIIKLAEKLSKKYKFASTRYQREGYSLDEVRDMSPNFIPARKKDALENLQQYVSDKNDPDYYFRFSDIPSLTINPIFGFSNTLGIYAHPLTRESIHKLMSGGLQMQDKEYILIFSAKDKSKIFNASKYDQNALAEDAQKLLEYAIEKFPELLGKEHSNFRKQIVSSLSGSNPVNIFISKLNDIDYYIKDNFGKYLFQADGKRYKSNLPYRILGYIGRYFVPGEEICFFSAAYLNDPIILENTFKVY